MRLFSGSSDDFITLNNNNQIAGLLDGEFFRQMGYKPSHGEVMSWRNSLLRMSVTLSHAGLKDQGVIVEYQLPNTSQRIDCVICGHNGTGRANAVVVELKQWEKCKLSSYDSERVLTWVGGGHRELLHPSVQVNAYKQYLEYYHTAFYEPPDPISLSACAYLHNYPFESTDPLFDERFAPFLKECPAFTMDNATELETFLLSRLREGGGMDLLSRIEKGECRPSKKLMQHVSQSVRDQLAQGIPTLPAPAKDYILLDDQIVAYDTVLSIVKAGIHQRQKHVLIIKGGPGTGKSVIALKLLADLNGLGVNAQYATGSKSFTLTLRRLVGGVASHHFKYFMSYGEVASNAIDVLILDEAHRIRERTVTRTRRATDKKQVEEILNSAKVCVFFVDDLQIVKPDEIGTVDHIRTFASRFEAKVTELELQSQFRCGGSDAFVNWVNNTLQIRRTANALWEDTEAFDFQLFPTPEKLETAIREKVSAGHTGRVTAGFCWPWSRELNHDGSLKKDVVIGNYRRPWNARYEAVGLRPGIPKAQFWAYDPNGMNQVGCIYTAQGFEFDYVGVIFGGDLRYDPEAGGWKGVPEKSRDSSLTGDKLDFLKNLKNRYRVLMTRGHRGCYVCFVDKETERFVRSRLVT